MVILLNRIEEVRQAWGQPGVSKLKLIAYIFNGLPNMTYPAGEAAYDASCAKYGGQTVWAPHNLWRQPFHMLVGAIIGVLTFGWYAAVPYAIWHEVQDLRERLAHQGNELGLGKMFADMFFFSLGGWLVHKVALGLWILTFL